MYGRTKQNRDMQQHDSAGAVAASLPVQPCPTFGASTINWILWNASIAAFPTSRVNSWLANLLRVLLREIIDNRDMGLSRVSNML